MTENRVPRREGRAAQTEPESPSPFPYDEAGVDRTLIREFLALSPLERLDAADAYAQEVEELRKLMRPGAARDGA